MSWAIIPPRHALYERVLWLDHTWHKEDKLVNAFFRTRPLNAFIEV